MHALVYTGTNKIDFRKEKDPIAKPGESIVKVKASGICGSDMHAFHGNDERRVPPLILGHEVSGISLDGKFKNKDVVINPLISCENCDYCKNEREHLCPERTMIGMSTPIKREGGLAEFVSVPEKNIFEVPEKELKTITRIIKDEMTSVTKSDLHSFSTSLTVDVNIGDNWGILH